MSNNRFYIAFEDTSNEQIYDAKLKSIMWTHTENRITGAFVDLDNGTWKPIGGKSYSPVAEKIQVITQKQFPYQTGTPVIIVFDNGTELRFIAKKLEMVGMED